MGPSQESWSIAAESSTRWARSSPQFQVQFILVSEKVPPRPAWYKNTYFWIAAALFLLSVLALVKGSDTIRDPGQKHENGLAWWYMLAAALMYGNGWLSHQQTVRAYKEIVSELPEAEEKI